MLQNLKQEHLTGRIFFFVSFSDDTSQDEQGEGTREFDYWNNIWIYHEN